MAGMSQAALFEPEQTLEVLEQITSFRYLRANGELTLESLEEEADDVQTL